MAIRFSLHGSVRNFSQGIERARQAEALGFEAIFVADSQMTCLDPFQALAICAGQTKRLGLGTAVTNMVYRSPHRKKFIVKWRRPGVRKLCRACEAAKKHFPHLMLKPKILAYALVSRSIISACS